MIEVVMPTYITSPKHLNMTLKCIYTARNSTDIEFRLIIVETCSNYLLEHADIHIFEKDRTSAGESINNGFGCCRGGKVVLLTNDVVLSDGWLESMLECFDKKKDCGISTVATNQFNHTKKDLISEGIWCSVFMTYREYAKFDEQFINSWEDSDMLMRIYKDGLKMYRNYNCVVEHEPGQTVYQDKLTQDNWGMNREKFIKKWKDSGILLYNHLVEGTVL